VKIGTKINSAFIGNVVPFCTRSTQIFTDLGNSLLDMQIMQFLLSYQCNDAVTAVGYIPKRSV